MNMSGMPICKLHLAGRKPGNPCGQRWPSENLSEQYPKDPEAGGALLKAADLIEGAGDTTGADAIRLNYVDRFPDDYETALAILHDAGMNELENLGPKTPISTILKDKGGKPTTRLGAYLKLAQKHPDLASSEIQARVQFLQG